jgi:hypothetical protein
MVWTGARDDGGRAVARAGGKLWRRPVRDLDVGGGTLGVVARLGLRRGVGALGRDDGRGRGVA